MAISLVARGLIDLKPLVTHRFKFEEAVKAFGVTQNGKDEDGKVSLASPGGSEYPHPDVRLTISSSDL